MRYRSFFICTASAITVALAVMGASSAHANNLLVSGMGGKCLDVEGGQIRAGARVIGYQCHAGANQQFEYFRSNGEIRIGGLCVDISGGRGNQGDKLILWQCSGQANQRWSASGNAIRGMNGLCLDLKGGSGHWLGNQEAIVWSCNGQSNQTWYRGHLVAASRVQGATAVQPGQRVDIRPISNINRIIASGGGNVIAPGGGNVIAPGGGNVIAPGTLN